MPALSLTIFLLTAITCLGIVRHIRHGSAFLGFLLGATRLLRLCQQKGVVVDVAAMSFLKALFTASMKADRAELEALAIDVKRLRELKHK